MKINDKINKILEDNKLEYYKYEGEYWLISEILKGQYFDDKFHYCTNARTKKDLIFWLENHDLKEIYEFIK